MATERKPEDTPAANAWGLMRAWLAQAGVSQADIDEMYGSKRGNSRGTMETDAKQWQKDNQ